MNVYITRKLHAAATELLQNAGHTVEVNPHDRPLTPDELRVAAEKSDAMLCLLNDKITAELMDAAPRCKMFANYAVGFDNMDVAAATQRNIALSNTPEDATDADALARYLVVEGEDEGSEAIFVAEGASTGGLWGFLPPREHELLSGMVPLMDETLFPLP